LTYRYVDFDVNVNIVGDGDVAGRLSIRRNHGTQR
jgi:hypothetical protein